MISQLCSSFSVLFGYLRHLQFCVNLRISFFISAKKGHWNFDRISMGAVKFHMQLECDKVEGCAAIDNSLFSFLHITVSRCCDL